MIEKMENKKEVEEKRIWARGGMGILLLLLLFDGSIHCGGSCLALFFWRKRVLFWAVFCWVQASHFPASLGRFCLQGLRC